MGLPFGNTLVIGPTCCHEGVTLALLCVFEEEVLKVVFGLRFDKKSTPPDCVKLPFSSILSFQLYCHLPKRFNALFADLISEEVFAFLRFWSSNGLTASVML